MSASRCTMTAFSVGRTCYACKGTKTVNCTPACRNLACRSPTCDLCARNAEKRCEDGFAMKKLYYEQEALTAACGERMVVSLQNAGGEQLPTSSVEVKVRAQGGAQFEISYNTFCLAMRIVYTIFCLQHACKYSCDASEGRFCAACLAAGAAASLAASSLLYAVIHVQKRLFHTICAAVPRAGGPHLPFHSRGAPAGHYRPVRIFQRRRRPHRRLPEPLLCALQPRKPRQAAAWQGALHTRAHPALSAQKRFVCVSLGALILQPSVDCYRDRC